MTAKRIVFPRVASSARSQMPERFARSRLRNRVEVMSAGSAPSTVDPSVIEVMSGTGIDIPRQTSQAVDGNSVVKR